MSTQNKWETIPEGDAPESPNPNMISEVEEVSTPTCEVDEGAACNGFCRSNSTKGDSSGAGESATEDGTKVPAPSSLPVVPNKNMKPPAKNCFRLVVLGSSRVGKTSLVSRFLTNKFEDTYTPTIEDFHRKLYRIRGDVYQLDILDTSGNHPFPAMRRLSFLTGDLFVLVFSWDSRDSWQEVMRLREQILETKQSASASSTGSRKKRGAPRVPMVIAGNKCDREQRGVTCEEVQEFVSSLSCCGYVDTSAKKEYNVDKLFYELFVLANLPMEMSPALHKRVCPCQPQQEAIGSGSRHRGLSIRRRLSEAYGMVAPNVRRPSIRTDLLILRAKTSLHLTGIDAFTDKKPRREVSCVIQ
ncbi:GTP-binding protein Rhes-like [Macrobrachium nipponense]|uniref:GTP-binding protein Rhes-like n=1 Tax=Macrobrachium nipponense TaxID=159736 RepID=UPI0030C8461A